MDICEGGLSSCTCQKRLSWHAEEPNVAKQLNWRIFTSWFGTYCTYIYCFLRFDASLKKLFVSCNYHVLFIFLAPMVFKVNIANIQCFWIFWDIQIMQDTLCTAVLTTIFFQNCSYQKWGLFFSFVGLILWLKEYVAFNDLHHLKILLCKCKMSFKIGSLMCEIYWEKKQHSIYHPQTFLGGQRSAPIFEKESEKMSAWGDLTSSFHRYLPDIYCVSCQ